jgi:hypothetical protein
MPPASSLETSEQLVDQLQEPVGVAVHHPERTGVGVVGRRGGQLVFQRPQDERERRAELVRNVGEKGGFEGVHLLAAFRTPAF